MGPILKHGFSRAAVAGTKFITWLLTLVLRFTIHGLETRKKYVFRVKSVSHAGNSNYSEESEAILVKAAISKDSSQLNQKQQQQLGCTNTTKAQIKSALFRSMHV